MSSLPLITAVTPLVKVLRYSHLGVAVSNIRISLDFYEKIGFNLKSAEDVPVVVMQNKGGLELHLFECDKGIDEDRNILMDFPETKYPGHTHASFSVPNVQSARNLLESKDLVISGERKMGGKLLSIFTRDPDRTTYEFEKNDGVPLDVEVTTEMIGYPQNIDHIGIRVSTPEQSWLWYAETLGFVHNAKKYQHNEDLIKNGPPWISRTETHVDINFIINANTQLDHNVLLADGVTRPGIIYAAYEVADVEAATHALQSAGIVVTRDADLHAHPSLSCLARNIITPGTGGSIFLEDSNHNLLRLVGSDSRSVV